MHWILPLCLALFSLAELFLLWTFLRKKEKTATKAAVSALVFVWSTFLVNRIFDFQIPELAFLFVMVSLFTDCYFGYYRNFYHRSRKFDRVQHAMGSFSFAVFFYFFLSHFFDYGGSKTFQAFYVLLLGVFVGMLYELFEFSADLKQEEKMQKGLRDTDFDMLSDVIGSLFAAAFVYFFLP